MTIAIDFDGTMVTDEFPRVGSPNPGAIETMKWLIQRGVKIILFTMRSHDSYYSDVTGRLSKRTEFSNKPSVLDDAIHWCEDNGIKLYGVNKNPSQIWSNSRKVYADYYIDDRCIGIPLTPDGIVDWYKVKNILERLV